MYLFFSRRSVANGRQMREIRSNSVERNDGVYQLAYISAHDRARGLRPESDAQQLRRTSGGDPHRTGDFAHEKTLRLQFPIPISQTFEGRSGVDDHLRAPIRNNALNVAEPWAVVCENPVS